MPESRVTERKRLFVENVCQGMSNTDAARAAGYSERSAKRVATKLVNHDTFVVAELKRRRAELAERTGVTVEAMTARLDQDWEFARETGNATAAVRASELKAKLHGLLVDRIDQRMVAGFTIQVSGIERDPPRTIDGAQS